MMIMILLLVASDLCEICWDDFWRLINLTCLQPVYSEVAPFQLSSKIALYDNSLNPFWDALPEREKQLIAFADILDPLPPDGPEEVMDTFLFQIVRWWGVRDSLFEDCSWDASSTTCNTLSYKPPFWNHQVECSELLSRWCMIWCFFNWWWFWNDY